MEQLDVFRDLPTLETARLRLRKVDESDVEGVFAYASDPEVARLTSWGPHGSREDSRRFVEFLVGRYQAGQAASWGMEHKADGKLIGTCGFGSWSLAHARAEIGYAMARAYWNQGLMTEAVRETLRFGFERMGLYRIEAVCEVANVGSARVMEKAGMSFEGVLRAYVFAKGRHIDVKMYSVLRPEWSGAA